MTTHDIDGEGTPHLGRLSRIHGDRRSLRLCFLVSLVIVKPSAPDRGSSSSLGQRAPGYHALGETLR